MKSLYLTYSNADFKKLKTIKENAEKKTKERIKWEDFVFNSVYGK